MECRVFTLQESHRDDLQELIFQLSGMPPVVRLDSSPNVLNIGLFDGNRLIGFAQLFLLYKTTFTTGHLEDVVVHSEYRGQGGGAKLIQKAISAARTAGCMVINLTARPERQAAYALYKKCDFVRRDTAVFRFIL